MSRNFVHSTGRCCWVGTSSVASNPANSLPHSSGIVTSNVKSWIFQRASNRVAYNALKQQHCNNPHSTSVDDDPLSQSDQSVWNQFFLDQELRGVIKQDVHRTGVDFFRKAEIQEIMTSILFLYARDNPKICYRQGMHEILAPVIFVLYNDLQIFEHIKETNPASVDESLNELLQLKYLEADAYSIFVVIMARIAEPYYRIHEAPEPTGHFAATDSTGQGRENEIIEQLNRIKDTILAKHDPVLCEHLQRLNIPLSIFGVRQLRLLFGREFSMPNLLLLWDAIFAEPADDYSLVDYIFVACLVHIRRLLLESDYNTALTYLMHYPSVDSVSNILRQAQVMKNSVHVGVATPKPSLKKPVKSNELPPIPNRRPQSKFLTNRPLPPMLLNTTLVPKASHDETSLGPADEKVSSPKTKKRCVVQ
jgi:TBC1 domain family member 5